MQYKSLKIKNFIIFFLWALFISTRFLNLNKVEAWEDNFSWLYRINYYPWILESNFKGIAEKDKDLKYAGTISYHPGVTIMTISGLSTRYGKKIISKIDSNYVPCTYNDSECKYLQTELILAKAPLIILTSVLFAYMLWQLYDYHNKDIRNNGFIIAPLVFGLIIVLEPLFYNTSRDLHLDFLQSSFITVAFITLLKKEDYILAGIMYGLATLTRFASVLFIPGIIALIIYNFLGNYKSYRILIRNLVIFFLTASIVFISLYPPMWVAPISTIKYLIEGSLDSTTSHNAALGEQNYVSGLVGFFTRHDFDLSITWISMFIGALIYNITRMRKNKYFKKEYIKIFIFFIGYWALLNFSEKKFFRYLTPIIMGLSIYVGFVWEEIVNKIIVKKIEK